MEAWNRNRLGDLVETQKGFAFKSSWYADDGRPIVRVSDFTEDSVDSSRLVCIPEEIASAYQKYELRTGDVVVQTVGSWPTNPASVVGKCIRIPSYANGALLNQNAVKIVPTKVLDAEFLFYLLRGNDFKSYIIDTAQGAASQAAITLEAIRAFEFAAPPLPIQRRIAGILSAYDELIENNQRRIRILEEMARSLYREWFVHENFPGGQRTLSAQKGKLGDMCDLVKKPFSEALDSERPLLDLSRMPQHSIAPASTGSPSELTTSRILFEPGDTLFGAIRCYLHKVVAVHYPGITNTSVLVLRPRSPSFRALVALIASDDETIRWADTHSTGTKMPVINWGVFHSMPAPLPSDELAGRFEAIVGPTMDQIGVLATQIQNLRRTRDLLLPRLLSGQVDLNATEEMN